MMRPALPGRAGSGLSLTRTPKPGRTNPKLRSAYPARPAAKPSASGRRGTASGSSCALLASPGLHLGYKAHAI